MSPARPRGQKVNLSDLAAEPDLDDGRGPYVVSSASGARSIRLDKLALNPLNKRVLTARPETIQQLAESLRVNGQLQPCAVVTRDAFRRIFPDHDPELDRAAFVQVTGARRYVAAQQIGWDALDVVIKDDLASTPLRFLSATASENIDRQDFDPIEEAEQVQLVVTAAGSGQAAAEHLQRSPGWVSQRLNLLKLVPELQAALRAGEIPLREARTLHTLPESEQIAALHRFTAVNRSPADDLETGGAPTPEPQRPDRPSPIARAIRRIGGTPDRIAATLRSELPPDEIALLVQHLLADTAGSLNESA
jgi:ParB family transcriptional regulator, chromosome partitioning protein